MDERHREEAARVRELYVDHAATYREAGLGRDGD
jgi:hypothetical protein